jgi:hypothetical protein
VLEFIYLDPAISKRLELLRRSGKKAALAAAKTEEIISRLKSGGEPPDQAGTLTRHGEKRIRGVRKYDLGSGYRLVAYRQRFRIYLLYVGTHDACHRWIENNRELALDKIGKRCAKLMVACDDTTSDPAGDAAASMAAEEDDDPLAQASERDLRQIFRGLVDAL